MSKTVSQRFKVTRAEVGGWYTSFSITNLDHDNPKNQMAPEAFFHHIGTLCNRRLEEIEGLEFTVTLPVEEVTEDTTLNLCGQTLTSISLDDELEQLADKIVDDMDDGGVLDEIVDALVDGATNMLGD